MIFRYTLDNDTEGSKSISDPIGWKELTIKLERSEKFSSLVEMIDVPLMFYGDNNSIDGGYDYIKNIETTQGINAIIDILIEIAEDDVTFETLFTGTLDLSTIRDISDAEFYKLECSVLRNDFWSKFTNRTSIPVSLEETTDLDGNTRTKIEPTSLPLESQIMDKYAVYDGSDAVSDSATSVTGVSETVQIGLPKTRDEIMNTFTLPIAFVDASLANLIETDEYGDLQITFSGNMTIIASATVDIDSVTVSFIAQKEGASLVTLDGDTVIVGATSCDETIAVSGSHTFSGVEPGQFYYIYGVFSINLNSSGNVSYTMGYSDFNLQIIQKSFTLGSITESYMIKDAAESICSKIIGRDTAVYSDYLDTCVGNFAIMRGIHLRGYNFLEKPFSLSFDDWWDGLDPILNLGLGYETVSGTEYIRIEEKAYFYNTTPSLNLDNVSGIVRTYDRKKIYKSIEVGYNKWSAESGSGLDDPQGKLTFSTLFEQIGQDLKIMSKFVAASLAIEQTRRNTREKSNDWRFDEEVMIIAVNSDGTPINPELDEYYDSITGLLNSDSRYNIILSVKRNLLRWGNVILGCLQSYTTSSLKFVRGEGNYDMSTDYNCGAGCTDLAVICDDIGEGTDLDLTSYATDIGYLHKPDVYEFEHDLSWTEYKTIRDGRKSGIGVSPTAANHETVFIESLEYKPFESTVTITGWLR